MLNISLNSPAVEKFIEEQLRAGHYASATDVILAGLSLLQHDPDAALPSPELAALQRDINLGLDQANRGEFVSFTAEDIIAEGLSRRLARNG